MLCMIVMSERRGYGWRKRIFQSHWRHFPGFSAQTVAGMMGTADHQAFNMSSLEAMMASRVYRPRDSQEKTFACPIPNCGKKFYHDTNLSRHKRYKHREVFDTGHSSAPKNRGHSLQMGPLPSITTCLSPLNPQTMTGNPLGALSTSSEVHNNTLLMSCLTPTTSGCTNPQMQGTMDTIGHSGLAPTWH